MSEQATITIREKQWDVSVASAPWELTQGLGGIPELPPGTGMLFDLGWPQAIQVTTVPMLFPLDIAFLSDTLVITEVYRDIQHGYLITSGSVARYFLEVNAGELEGIESGDQASVELLPLQGTTVTPDWMSMVISFMGFALIGAFVITLAKNFAKGVLEEPKELRRTEPAQSEIGLLNSRRFLKRAEVLNKLRDYDVLHVHEDGDLTVRSRGKLFVVTTEGQLFEQKPNSYYSSRQAAGVCEMVSPQYYELLRLVGVPLPDYSFAIEPEVKERKIDDVLKRLKEGVEGIQASGNFRQFLLTMSKFHDYSIGNLILIAMQRPDATRVAGFNTWKDLGRWVKKGEKGIAILAPCLPPKKTAPTVEQIEEEGEEEKKEEIRPLYFKVVHVFDISQTEGEPLPEFEVPTLTGEANEELFTRVMNLTKAQGLEVSFESRPHQDTAIKGTYFAGSIWIRPEEPQAQQLKTFLHEVAHYYTEGVFHIPRRDAETIAESAAFAVGAHFGFDTGVRSFPYVALWAQDKKVLEQNLTSIRKVSAEVIQVLEQVNTW